MASVLVLYCLVLRDAYDDRPRPVLKLTAGALLAAVLVALQAPQPTVDPGAWETIVFIWLASAALYLPLWSILTVGAALVTVLTVYVSVATDLSWQGALMTYTFSALVWPSATLVWRWVWRTIRDAYDSQQAKARLAVSEERLRFARDLHDLLGHSLSVITLKSELSAKMATKDAARAATEMSEVRRLAAESLAEVQVAVDGYRALDLDEELAGVRAALEAAGARCTIEARADELSPPARTLLAWAVREGATNVLKHSRATRCSITIDGGVLEMRNDGVQAPVPGSGTGSGTGSGLRGLAERMATAGGSFSAAPTPAGEFVLRAEVPA
jgi:two-component system sensor histidine kinase DesK